MPAARPVLRVAPVLACVLLGAPAAPAQDLLQLQDGRFVSGPPMTRKAEGVVVHFRHGDVLFRNELVKEASVSKVDGGDAPAVPAQDQARIDAGFVRFEGRWVKPEERTRVLEGRRLVRAKKIADAMAHRKWANRWKSSTPNFEIESTIDPDKVKEYGDLLDTYYRVFTKEWGISKPAGMGKLKVCFYHDAETYRQVSGAPAGVIGYFKFTAPEELNFYYERIDERQTIDVMFHEANHYLTHLIDPKFHYPPWVNESLAEYYGASSWDPKKKEMKSGHLQEGRLAVIQDAINREEWQGLEELIRLEQGAFQAIHYAWGWSFVHFLLQSKRYERPFKNYYLGLARDSSVQRAERFIGTFGRKTVSPDEQVRYLLATLKLKELKVLEKDWHAFVKALEPAGARGFLEAGNFALRWGMPIKAQRLFKTAIEKGSRSPLAYAGLAEAAAAKGKFEEAAEAFTKALELDPLAGILWAGLARCRARELGDGKHEEVRRLRRLALEVSPDDDRLLFEAGFDEILEEKPAGPG